MESDNESFNLEDLPMFLNSVLEKAELICREENVDSGAVETTVLSYFNMASNILYILVPRFSGICSGERDLVNH